MNEYSFLFFLAPCKKKGVPSRLLSKRADVERPYFLVKMPFVVTFVSVHLMWKAMNLAKSSS